jgi:dTDP-3-amino-2,3,6-trideoxy-4-keto-D-glucose/dTDP-3-amino-3,4,6-trideoxy-alpha-D-glucose/dTDP-2,6-dideoxy-D-kanosamine transaminase
MLPPYWDYRREYQELRDEILASVDRVFKSGQLILGEEGASFERQMAASVGVRGAVGVNSGTDAIFIALAAVGVAAGDEVITVPNTAVATVAAIGVLGARPVFVDVGEDFLMDVDQVEAAITPRTKAIVPVHLYGQCVDLDPLAAIAKRHGLKIVEDCAQAQGSLYRNRRCGSIGDAAAFSFYPTKLLGGYGDGGMVVSDDEAVVALARSLRFYGIESAYHAERHGFNSRLDEVQAAILSLKLPRIEDWISRRRAIASRYRAGLAGCSGLRMPKENAWSRHVYHLFVVETAGDRDALLQRLEARGLKSAVQYRWPVHLMRGYQDLGYRAGQFPVAEKKAQHIFSLPIYPHLRDEEVDEVIDVVKAAL